MSNYNYNLDPTCDYSKVDLVNHTGLSKNTVYEALKIAGLSTSQRMYRGQELIDRFVPVRLMFESGMDKAEIEQQLNMKTANSVENNGHFEHGDPMPQTSPVTDFSVVDSAIGQGVEDAMTGIVEARVMDFIENLPGIAARALANAAESGQIRAAFSSKLRDYYKVRHTPADPAIVSSTPESLILKPSDGEVEALEAPSIDQTGETIDQMPQSIEVDEDTPPESQP